jgi:hypothetical protein
METLNNPAPPGCRAIAPDSDDGKQFLALITSICEKHGVKLEGEEQIEVANWISEVVRMTADYAMACPECVAKQVRWSDLICCLILDLLDGIMALSMQRPTWKHDDKGDGATAPLN